MRSGLSLPKTWLSYASVNTRNAQNDTLRASFHSNLGSSDMAMCEAFRGAQSVYEIVESSKDSYPYHVVHCIGRVHHTISRHISRVEAERALISLHTNGKKVTDPNHLPVTTKKMQVVWKGRDGKGLLQDQATEALVIRKKSKPGLEWRVEPMPEAGRFKIVGYGNDKKPKPKPAADK